MLFLRTCLVFWIYIVYNYFGSFWIPVWLNLHQLSQWTGVCHYHHSAWRPAATQPRVTYWSVERTNSMPVLPVAWKDQHNTVLWAIFKRETAASSAILVNGTSMTIPTTTWSIVSSQISRRTGGGSGGSPRMVLPASISRWTSRRNSTSLTWSWSFERSARLPCSSKDRKILAVPGESTDTLPRIVGCLFLGSLLDPSESLVTSFVSRDIRMLNHLLRER